MLKRTKGRLLITLLVTTGLAGTINNSSLSQKERKQAIGLIKSSRMEVLNSIQTLSPKQLNYKTASEHSSIGELIISMVDMEIKGTNEIKNIMDQPANPENRLKITLTDEQLLANDNYTEDEISKEVSITTSQEGAEEALKNFTLLRNNHIKYIRTSTEDLRNHVTNTPAGWIDCYQYFLLLADRSTYFSDKINKIKSSPDFPKK